MSATFRSITLSLLFVPLAFGQKVSDYTAADAAKHIGETATVTDKVESVFQAKGGNIFIDMGGKHPNAVFTAFIPASNAAAFPNFKEYQGAVVTISGKIDMHKNKPQIVVTEASQISIKTAAVTGTETAGETGKAAAASPTASPSPTATP